MKYSPNKKFMIKTGPLGFGYCIVKLREEGELNNTRIFHSSNKEQVKELFLNIEDNHTDLPEPETDWVPQNLKIKTKHYDYSYLVKSIEDLREICFNYVKTEWESKYSRPDKWEIPDKYTIQIEESVIDAIPDADIRKQLREKNLSNKREIASYNEHNRIIDIADKIIENNEVKKGYSLFQECEFLYYSYELNNFDN